MKNKTIEQFISKKRLQQYGNFEEYKENLYLSEKSYILLSVFEISLRNSINFYFCNKYSDKWLFIEDILHDDTKQKIKKAKTFLSRRNEKITHDKIVAELSFSFWTSLFRKSYDNMMRINDIKAIFPNIPLKKDKRINRSILDKKLNHIRKFRNRVFHYEKIINKVEFNNIEDEIYELLLYFDEEIYNFAKSLK
ncbi:hypothetical protein QUF74_16270 [Candidatus Halobeggiatoa sp. HSG11]|nr:hypothetical protein [Candidatus Halobeggiatoa sp. HSG11]